MKHTYKLQYFHDYGDSGDSRETDEYFCSAHNVTTAKERLLQMLQPSEKPLKLYEHIKGNVEWKEHNVKEQS